MDKGPAERVTVRVEKTGCAISWDAPSTEHQTLSRAEGSGAAPRTRLPVSTEKPRRVPQWLDRTTGCITTVRALVFVHAPMVLYMLTGSWHSDPFTVLCTGGYLITGASQ